MLNVVGISAAPENAFTDVKSNVDYICRKNNQKGAVSELIFKYICKKP